MEPQMGGGNKEVGFIFLSAAAKMAAATTTSAIELLQYNDKPPCSLQGQRGAGQNI